MTPGSARGDMGHLHVDSSRSSRGSGAGVAQAGSTGPRGGAAATHPRELPSSLSLRRRDAQRRRNNSSGGQSSGAGVGGLPSRQFLEDRGRGWGSLLDPQRAPWSSRRGTR